MNGMINFNSERMKILKRIKNCTLQFSLQKCEIYEIKNKTEYYRNKMKQGLQAYHVLKCWTMNYLRVISLMTLVC